MEDTRRYSNSPTAMSPRMNSSEGRMTARGRHCWGVLEGIRVCVGGGELSKIKEMNSQEEVCM